MMNKIFISSMSITMALITSPAAAWVPGYRRGSHAYDSWYGITPILLVLVVFAAVCLALLLSRMSETKRRRENLEADLKARYVKGELAREELDSEMQDLKNTSYLDCRIRIDSLNERYAQGKITRSEFEEKLKDLREESLLAVLIPRYARGEITKEEFERIRNDTLGQYTTC